jgi:hypothetical protein
MSLNRAIAEIFFNEENGKSLVEAYNEARKAGYMKIAWPKKNYDTEYAYYLIHYLVHEKLLAGTFDDNLIFKIQNRNK